MFMVPGTNGGKMKKLIIKNGDIADVENERLIKADIYCEDGIIKQIGDPIQQRVIYSYIRGKRTTFDAIACAENYCLRTISRVYRAGIDDLVNKGLLTDTENTQENAL